MLLSQLFEMPYLKNSSMKMGTIKWDKFYSNDTLERNWKLLKEWPDQQLYVYISNDHMTAFIGGYNLRESDGKPGIDVLITVEFKHQQILSHAFPSPQLGGALQVDVVEAHNVNRIGNGDGVLLYAGIVEAGITVISDNTQYRGGKQLWKKLASSQHEFGYVVNVIENGKPFLDDQGHPFVYNGANIPDDELWSERPPEKTRPAGAPEPEYDPRPDKYMTLFVMRKK